jgi:outer membrane cobalamin receptor
MFRTPLATALLSVTLVACVAPSQVPRPVTDPLMITADEITYSRATTAYDAIQRLRANFLSRRGETSFLGTPASYPTVYVDGLKFGGIDALRGIPAAQIATIQLFRSWDATTRYGNSNAGGVIAVTTRLERN